MALSMPRLRRPSAARTVVGLDIEPGAVRAVAARVEGGRLVVERSAEAALEPRVVRDGEVVEPEALAEALRALFDEHKLDRRVRIGVANQRVVVRHLVLPPIEDPKQLATAVRFLAAEELPMPIDQAVLDHVVLGTVETPEGPRTRVMVVAARRSMVDALLSAAAAAGLRPEGVDLAAFAMLRCVGSGGAETALHVAIGGVVNLAVVRDGECAFTRVVAGGTEAMAIELAERAMADIDEARAAVLAVRLDGDEPEGDDLAAQAHAVVVDGLRRIAGEVRNSLDFHLGGPLAHGEEARAVERVVLTGVAAGIAGLPAELSRRLALPVEAAGVEGGDASFAVAAGLSCAEAPA